VNKTSHAAQLINVMRKSGVRRKMLCWAFLTTCKVQSYVASSAEASRWILQFWLQITTIQTPAFHLANRRKTRVSCFVNRPEI